MRRVEPVSIGDLEIHVDTLGRWLPVTVRDVSVIGIGLATADYVAPGTTVALRQVGLSRWIMADVVCAIELPGGMWSLGCRFVQLLTVDDMLDLSFRR